MITVEEAVRLVMAHVPRPVGEQVPLSLALRRFTAADVRAPNDHPLFDCSAVDGYAFRHGTADAWTVVGTVAAGEVLERTLGPGECARIFTGAMVPRGADTVVMQEAVHRDGDRITHADGKLAARANVRLRGEQVRAGDVLLLQGHLLSPAAIGLLASVGIEEAAVGRLPRVQVLVTGDEFMRSADLEEGRIFSSNDRMLEAMFAAAGIPCTVEHVKDDAEALRHAIIEGARKADVVLTTGGASVGDHDLVHQAVEQAGTVRFHGVAQKPGKPMLFAEVGGVPFFGLPGNPRAVFVLMHVFVLPFLRAMQGASDPWSKSERLPIAQAITVKGARAEFRAARVEGGRVTLLADEGSHMLRSLIDADGLAYIPASVRGLQAGDAIEVRYLPR